MASKRGWVVLAALFLGCASSPPPKKAAVEAGTPVPSAPKPALEDAHHLLQRFSFGPTPEETRRVTEIGVEAWVGEQLAPPKRVTEVPEAYRTALRPPRELARELDKDDFQVLVATAQMAELSRHVTSERQVEEVMVDFWTNHFNVFARKGFVKLFAADFVERAIRPHALGRFEDLLVATARHPAMLLYLDNAKSVAPGTRRGKRQRGLNENYARELLELHTIGVGGGYTQTDVIEVARVLTGWSVRRPREGEVGFVFRPRLHDDGEKRVLGTAYPAGGGEAEGMLLLRRLASHPKTATHLAGKLCARFVADEPPRTCIDRVSAAYRSSNGDARELVRAIATGPELWAPENRGTKLKTPLEFLTSALRATGARPDGSLRLARVLGGLGQPLLLEPVPTGYAEDASAWAQSGALLARMNAAAALAAGRLPGAEGGELEGADDVDGIVSGVNEKLFAGRASPHTLGVIREQIADLPEPENRRALALALALGSPDFQKQ